MNTRRRVPKFAENAKSPPEPTIEGGDASLHRGSMDRPQDYEVFLRRFVERLEERFDGDVIERKGAVANDPSRG